MTGGSVNLRDAPDPVKGRVLGIVFRNQMLEYLGKSSAEGWHQVRWKDQALWISGKYSAIEVERK